MLIILIYSKEKTHNFSTMSIIFKTKLHLLSLCNLYIVFPFLSVSLFSLFSRKETIKLATKLILSGYDNSLKFGLSLTISFTKSISSLYDSCNSFLYSNSSSDIALP